MTRFVAPTIAKGGSNCAAQRNESDGTSASISTPKPWRLEGCRDTHGGG